MTLPQYLRFILDSDNDDHYTDSLITMHSANYIWYRLRQEHPNCKLLFLRVRNNQIVFHVYDNNARRYLQQYGKHRPSMLKKEQTGNTKDYPLQSLRLNEPELLSKLLSDKEQTTLIFTREAFERICCSSNEEGIKLLEGLLEGKPVSSSNIYIRLPLRTAELENCVHPQSFPRPILEKAYSPLLSIAGNAPVPLLQAMTQQLGPQLLRFDVQPQDSEMLNLLLQMALDDPASPDSPEQLLDQAEYLELCRNLRIKLLKPDFEQERYTPLSRREVAERLRVPAFRSELRQAIRELRAVHPDGSIHSALSQQMHLPELPPCPAYEDNLALSLNIDNVSSISRATWAAKLDHIKRSLITVWSKPRNPTVLKITRELCSSAHSAISDSNWVALGEILTLLEFFCGQLCAPEDRNAALEKVRKWGYYIIEMCEDIKKRSKFATHDSLDEFTIDTIDQMNLKKVRSFLSRTIYCFGRTTISDSDMRSMEEDWNTTQQEILRDTEYLHEESSQQQQTVLSFAYLREEEDDDDLSDLSFSAEEPIVVPDPDLSETSAISMETEPTDHSRDDQTFPMEMFTSQPLDPDRYLQEHFDTPFSFANHSAEPDFG